MKRDPEVVEDVEVCPIGVGEDDGVENSGPTHSKLDATVQDAWCQDETCNHPLTAHSRGLAIHGRCLMLGCKCTGAKLTDGAIWRVKRGIIA